MVNEVTKEEKIELDLIHFNKVLRKSCRIVPATNSSASPNPLAVLDFQCSLVPRELLHLSKKSVLD